MKTCQHKLGHYMWAPSGADKGPVNLCGKVATHVAAYPNSPKSYYCRKHSKTRHYITEIEPS
jgi:hypothetical protein